MTETLPSTILAPLSDFLATQMGLHFPSNRWLDLDRGILAAAKEFGFRHPEACVEWLLSSPLTKPQIETLASQLTVGETYFFRERQCFRALEEQILPELIRVRSAERRLRVWSAGCATGEEPYSLAILLARLIPDLARWNVSILGTDINPHALQKASHATYSTWSFRDCPAGFAEQYFTKSHDGLVTLHPEIRKMVSFAYLNLVDDIYPSLLNETNALDLIFCRNVLMYFALDQAKHVIGRFHRCLLEGSWLVVSATEASHVLFPQFSTVNFPGAILYKKVNPPIPEYSLPPLPTQDALTPVVQDSPDFFTAPGEAEIALPCEVRVGVFEVEIAAEEPLPEPPPPDPFVDYAEGRFERAAEGVRALLVGEPDNVKAMALLARILANQGQLTPAREWCDKAIAVEKLDPGFHYLRATILQEQGEAEEAAKALERALYLDHRFVLAHFALGNLNRVLGRHREAEKHFKNTLRLLKGHRQEEILPESEGITAGRLREVIERTRTFD